MLFSYALLFFLCVLISRIHYLEKYENEHRILEEYYDNVLKLKKIYVMRTGRRQRMSILLEIRDYIQKFYQKSAAVLNVILRFLAAFITFFATNRVIGFNPYLDHTYTELVFAAVSVDRILYRYCCFLKQFL